MIVNASFAQALCNIGWEYLLTMYAIRAPAGPAYIGEKKKKNSLRYQ